MLPAGELEVADRDGQYLAVLLHFLQPKGVQPSSDKEFHPGPVPLGRRVPLFAPLCSVPLRVFPLQ